MIRKHTKRFYEADKEFHFYKEQDFRSDSEYPLIELCNDIKQEMIKFQNANNQWEEAGVMDYGTGSFTLWFQRIGEKNQTTFELYIASTEKSHKCVMYSHDTGKKLVISTNRVPYADQLEDAFNKMF